MKAARYYGIHDVRVEEVPVPEYDPRHGVLVKVAATAICGTDLRIYNHGHARITRPLITGHEITGTVAAVGSAVCGWQVGDRVAVAPPAVVCEECPECRAGVHTMCRKRISMGYELDGGFAEYVAISPKGVKQGHLLRIPDGLDIAEAALTEPLACCINGQDKLRIGPGDRVAVLGAGAIGIMHTELARAAGADAVFLADLSGSRLEMARRCRLDGYVNSSDVEPVAVMRELTGGEGPTVVIVACSSGVAQEQAIQMVARRGRVSLFAGLPKDKPTITLDANKIHYQEIEVYGANSSALPHNQRALSLIAEGKVNARALTTHTLPLEQLVEGFGLAARGESLKVVIRP